MLHFVQHDNSRSIVMLRACAEAAEVSSEASRPLDNQGIFDFAKTLATCHLRDFSDAASAASAQALEMT